MDRARNMRAAEGRGTASTRAVVRVIGWMTRLSHGQAAAICAGSIAVLALGDFATGTEYAFSALYILPMCLAAWSLGERAGLLVGLVCSALVITLNGFGGATSATGVAIGGLAAVWNTAMRVLAIVTIVMLVGGFRRTYDVEHLRARTDPLTGTLTKDALLARSERMLSAARSRGTALLLAYVDLDGFKGVNDGYGHAAGDAVLRTFASGAAEAMRKGDRLARIGGDEFLLLMCVSDVEEGHVAAERLHRHLSGILGRIDRGLTCSMGALVIDGAAGGGQDVFVDHADRLMYEVKRAGKNAFRVARADAMVGDALRAAFHLPDDGGRFAGLLQRLDTAERPLAA